MTTQGNLIRALHKIERYDKDVWCGYFTPSEILTLVENGIQVQEHNDWVVDYAKRKKNEGKCSPMWFYFKLGKLKNNPHLKEFILKQNTARQN